MGAIASQASSVLARKLSQFIDLSAEERALLDRLAGPAEPVAPRADIMIEGQAPRTAVVLAEGLAARYRVLPDGGRQILTFVIPGDACDSACLSRCLDYSVAAISAVRVASIGLEDLSRAFARHARLAAAWQWSVVQEAAMLREHVVALGRRRAPARVAYLLCELLWRHEAIGLAQGQALPWPLTQAELGDALGLTSVSVNRVLQDFRRAGIIATSRGWMCVLDAAALQRQAGTSRDYLRPVPVPVPVPIPVLVPVPGPAPLRPVPATAFSGSEAA